ncbi:MAG: cellulase family glycosylhydrolase [Fibrobacter sp.]|nr:cellulase family glycosylhydrolase [Fibrobacter sp.]
MKYPHLALAAMLSSFGLLACSDDPKPTEGVEPSSSATIGGDIPVPSSASESSSSAVVMDDPNAEIPTVPNQTVTLTNVSLSGAAAVGPMYKGATVSVTGIDPSTFTAIGTAAQASVSTDNGDYSLSGSVGSPYVTATATGSYYNYILDTKYGPVTLDAVTNVAGRTNLNVNVLTHIEAARVKMLVTTFGMTFNDAKVKAEKEIRLAFGLPSDSTLFEDISLSTESQAGANLMAVTTALMGELDGTTFSTYLNYIRDDIAIDGVWDDEVVKAKFGDDAYAVFVNSAVLMLKSYTDQSVSYFENEIVGFWGAQYGLGFCTEEGTLANCSNVNSVNAGKTFMCSNGKWGLATEEILKSIALVPILGECNSAVEGTMKQHEGVYYACKKNFWVVASAEDIANSLISATAGACDDTRYGNVQTHESQYYVCVPPVWTKTTHKPVDYSKGNAMNKKLGKGMNFGNSWEAPSADDSGWSNPIDDGDFAVIKNAGFNSVRIPVRWYSGVDTKISGVKKDVDLAIAQGLTVVINYHHYEPMHEAAKSYPNGNYPSVKQEYLNVWKRVAQTFSSYSADKLVFEIYNEPRGISQEAVDDIMLSAYEVIRAAAPNHTIMFEGNEYSKFAQISKVKLPEDGNIIFTGHYYEPYSFSHQGSHSSDGSCKGDAAYGNKAASDMKDYVDRALIAYPDINGGHVPLNMGEFGIAKVCNVSDAKRTQWTKLTVQAAEANGMSWHYWCFKNCGGFEAYSGSWMSGFLNAFGLQ